MRPNDPRMIRLLNYYRDAELHGAGLLMYMAEIEREPSAVAKLTRHIADETRHAAIITRHISDLGGKPQRVCDGYQRRMARAGGIPRTLLELYAATHVAESRAQARYTAHLRSVHADPHTASILRSISSDEEWHLTWVDGRLRDFAAINGRPTIDAALRRFRDADAVVCADLAGLERETFGFTFAETASP